MLKFNIARQRGDTIIEVLLAMTVFSLVAVGAITIMNQGTNSAQRAIEITMVKQQIDAQAEALRAAQQTYLASLSDNKATEGSDWKKITGTDLADTGEISVVDDNCPSDFKNAFIMNSKTARVSLKPLLSSDNENAPPYSQVVFQPNSTNIDNAYGIWIERSTESTGTSLPNVYNFRIRACWYGPGLATPMQLQTIVRLYAPSN